METKNVGFLSSGSILIDKFLSGGYPKQITTCIYGEAGCGKTTLCILAQISAALSGKKVIYFDVGNNFSYERLKQLTKDSDKVMQRTIFFRPKTFEEERRLLDSLDKLNGAGIGLIIFDSVANNYKMELSQTSSKKAINDQFNSNLKKLSDFYKENNVPVIVTSTIYSTVVGEEEKIMSGGNILKNRAKSHIELLRLTGDLRAAVLKKHPSEPKDKMVEFRIKKDGLVGV